MNNMRNKIFSLLVLLMTAATGAWADDYYLVGNMNDWGPSKQFQLTQNPDKLAEYMITLTFKAGAEFKVIGVDGAGNWTWYPDPGYNYYVNNAGEYTVYFRPDGQGGDDWHEHCIYAAAAPAPAIPVTDLGSNTWQFTMPDYAVVANIEYDTDLELREENVNTTVLAEWDGYNADVTMHRTLKAGSWNTLTMPYALSTLFLNIMKSYYGITAVKELTDATLTDGTLKLTFADAASVVAGKPYLVKVENDLDFSTQAISNVTVSKTLQPVTSDYVEFVPTLGRTLVTGPEDAEDNKDAVLFLAAGNKLVNPKVVNNPEQAESYIKGFRAYFRLKGNAVNAASFNLDMGDGETTGISSMHNSECIMHNEYFDLQGRRVAQPTKGIYIVNGKKIVVK